MPQRCSLQPLAGPPADQASLALTIKTAWGSLSAAPAPIVYLAMRRAGARTPLGAESACTPAVEETRNATFALQQPAEGAAIPCLALTGGQAVT